MGDDMLKALVARIAILAITGLILGFSPVRAEDAAHVGHDPGHWPDPAHPHPPPYLSNSQPTSGSQQITVGGTTLLYSLQCMTKRSASKLSANSAEETVRLGPNESLLGYSVTSGSCDFTWQPTIPGLIHGVASEDQPITESKSDGLSGWLCKIGDNVKPNGRDLHKYQVTAHLVACKVSMSESAFGSQAIWTTPGDGTLVMLMRSAKGFDANSAIPFSMQICMTGENSKLSGNDRYSTVYVWTTAGSNPGGDNQKAYQVPLGQCAQIDKPAAVIVQQTQDEGGIVSGFYELLPAGTFSNQADAKIGLPYTASKQPKPAAQLGAPSEIAATCTKLPTPTTYYWASCQLQLPNASANADKKGYRVCIGADYLTQPDGTAPYPAYAVSLLDITLSASLLEAVKDSPYNYNWSPIFPGGCRDLIFATEAFFEIGPNYLGYYWDPSKITSIKATVQEITWN